MKTVTNYFIKAFILMVLSNWITNLLAQTPQSIISDANADLRHLLDPIVQPYYQGAQSNHLYERAVHIMDSSYFFDTPNIEFISNTWYESFDEARNMAKDTGYWPNFDSVYNYAQKFNDSIPIAFFDFTMLSFKDSTVFEDSVFFYADTSNNQLYDMINRPSDPYYYSNVFAASTLKPTSYFRNVKFVIDPLLMLKDSINSLFYSNNACVLKVDFGDGSGWHQFSLLHKTGIEIIYSDTGEYKITVKIEVEGVIIKKSLTLIAVLNDILEFPPAAETASGLGSFTYNETKVGYYPPCEDVPASETKLIIYVTGFVPFENGTKDKTVSKFYDKLIHSKNISQLSNYGYGIYIIDWKNSQQSIYQSTDDLVDILDEIKCRNPNDYEFVMISNSGGSPIARRALAYMETDEYVNGERGCFQNKMHNTRLWISNDGIFQGANIPIGVQDLYNDELDGLAFTKLGKKQKEEMREYSLNSPAAKQLLKYHYSTESNNLYKSTVAYDGLLNDTEQIKTNSKGFKGYPDYCKMITIVQGKMNGDIQKSWDNVAPKQTSDEMINLTFDRSIRILGTQLTLLDATLIMKNNPASSITATTYDRFINIHRPKVKLIRYNVVITNWLTIKRFKFVLTTEIAKTEQLIKKGRVAKSIDTAPGSAYNMHNPDLWQGVNTSSLNNVINTLPGVVPSAFQNITTMGYNSNVIYSLSTNNKLITGTTQGLGFCFAPTTSTIDYKGPGDQFTNLSALVGINNLMDYTPFDVVIGEIPESYNRTHCMYINFELTQPLSINQRAYYLNREIGEEIHYYNNRTAIPGNNYKLGGFGEVHMGVQSPYYNGATLIMPDPISHPDYQNVTSNQTMYSKEAVYDSDCTLPTLTYSTTYTTNFTDGNTYDVACSSYAPTYVPYLLQSTPCDDQQRPAMIDDQSSAKSTLLFPNPNTGAFIQFTQPVSGLSIFNLQGQLLLKSDANGSQFQLEKPLQSGIYLVQFTDVQHRVQTQKLIVQ